MRLAESQAHQLFPGFFEPGFFICAIDAKSPFKPCYRIQTCYRPELARNSTLSSKESCCQSRNSGFFAKINITNFQALFCWFCQTYGTALFSYTESIPSGDAETAPPLFCVLGGGENAVSSKAYPCALHDGGLCATVPRRAAGRCWLYKICSIPGLPVSTAWLYLLAKRR